MSTPSIGRMAVQRTFPILSTRDLERLEAFYRDAFGAERVYAYADDGRDVYIAMQIGASTVSIGLDDDLPGPPVEAALWIYVDDVDRSHRAALEAGATSVAEPELMPWGERVAQVRDPDGFLLYLGAEASDEQD
ncbi:putative glyoxalase superfamily protein PhnB [Agrococcus jenensis]|uniref:Putative glyoxalase superfamily protein PhnB n=2 Tax=Agrococcus jenensis TaxID=46353 RepID=A0A3N2AWL7_9MICO|nr:putative glyoxalase superfamily protein PhnB [Agrococcus jenensis]